MMTGWKHAAFQMAATVALATYATAANTAEKMTPKQAPITIKDPYCPPQTNCVPHCPPQTKCRYRLDTVIWNGQTYHKIRLTRRLPCKTGEGMGTSCKIGRVARLRIPADQGAYVRCVARTSTWSITGNRHYWHGWATKDTPDQRIIFDVWASNDANLFTDTNLAVTIRAEWLEKGAPDAARIHFCSLPPQNGTRYSTETKNNGLGEHRIKSPKGQWDVTEH